MTLKRISASALSDVAKHSPELAQAVVDAGAVAYLAPLILHPDVKLKRQVSLDGSIYTQHHCRAETDIHCAVLHALDIATGRLCFGSNC